MINNKGQSIFEFLFFFPLMMVLFIVVIKIGNSINGAINQQKITRGYLYALQLNDSNLQTNRTLGGFVNFNVVNAGLYALGWADKLEGESPIAPCYSLPAIGVEDNEEVCDQRQEDNRTSYIRVKTAYGLCSESFHIINGLYYRGNNIPGFSVVTASEASCVNL